MLPIDEATSANTSITSPASDRNLDVDKSAADRARNPLSWLWENILRTYNVRSLGVI